jgi:hypothetical protein
MLRLPGLSVNLLLLLVLTHFLFPRARPTTRKFFALSHYDPATDTYTQGWDDLCLVSFYIVVFMGLRAVVIDYVLTPFASWGGIRKKKARIRFAEQAWVLLYDSSSCGLGLVRVAPFAALEIDVLRATAADNEDSGSCIGLVTGSVYESSGRISLRVRWTEV